MTTFTVLLMFILSVALPTGASEPPDDATPPCCTYCTPRPEPTTPVPTVEPTLAPTPQPTAAFCCGDFRPVDGQVLGNELQSCAICYSNSLLATPPTPLPAAVRTSCAGCDCNHDGYVTRAELDQVKANATAKCGPTMTPTRTP